eukprot:GDKI01025073.1.p1 GENE.GDKI01025073.1~~GDKI01025073.1.p1  ORF type:complete len:781 (-),score=325.83 GDKI01025073.1:529-2871(-)
MFILFTAGGAPDNNPPVPVPVDPVPVTPGENDMTFPCVSADCTMVSGNMLTAMDFAVDACDDAYSFSCGNFMKTFELPEEESSWTLSFSEISKRNRNTLRRLLDEIIKDNAPPKLSASAVEETETSFRGSARNLLAQAAAGDKDPWDAMLAAFYGKCMDTDTLDKDGKQPLLDVFAKYMPFLLKSADELKAEDTAFGTPEGGEKATVLGDRIGIFHSFGLSAFFGSYVTKNTVHTELDQTLNLLQDGLGLQYAFYSKDPKDDMSKKFQTTYVGHMTKLFELMGADATSAAARAQSVLDLEFAMRDFFLSPIQRRDPIATTNPVSVSELSGLIGKDNFDFDTYWKYTNSILPSEQQLKDDTELIVESKEFFTKLGAFLTSADWVVVHDYLLVRAMSAYGDYLSAEWRNEFDRYSFEMSGAKAPPRWRTCLGSTKGQLAWILSRRFVQKAFEPARRDLAKDILKKVEEAFGEQIKNVAWMDEQTKEKALTKLGMIGDKIGYPDWVIDDADKKFAEMYGKPSAEVTAGTWLEAVVHLTKEAQRYAVSKIGTPQDRTEWSMDPATVNAYYAPDMNEIVFPASILQPPFLYLPDTHASRKEVVAFMALNYGAYGAVVGHEITHGFDDSGAQFDGTGKLESWWTEQSEKNFNEATKCVADQYDAYTIEDGKFHVHGELTLGENIADNGGFRTAYRALRAAVSDEEWNMKPFPGLDLTTPQMFMLSFSQIWCSKYTSQTLRRLVEDDPHSPGMFRVQGVLSNSPQFAELYQCKAGQTLNPEKRCTVW